MSKIEVFWRSRDGECVPQQNTLRPHAYYTFIFHGSINSFLLKCQLVVILHGQY